MEEGIHEFFDEGGILSRSLPRYEFRPQQLEMSLEAGAAVENGEILLVEAGTGVGKSLSYLVPLLLRAVNESKRIFVATGTKTLQHQLIEKELPFLRKHLPVDFSYALCLGAENYVCERRLADLAPSEQGDLFGNADEIARLKDWAEGCKAGLRSEIEFSLSPQTWYQACRIPELCVGQDCGKGGDCFYQRARRRMNKAEVLVGNHHLLFANLRAGWEYLPQSQILVVDEAHNLDSVASDCLGIEFSHRALRRVWEGLRGKDGEGCLIGALHELRLETRQKLLAQVREAEKKFAETIHWFHQQVLQGEARVVVTLETARLGLEHFLEPLSEVVASLKMVSDKLTDEERALECNGYAIRLNRVLKEAKTVIEMLPDAPWLLWCEEFAPRARATFESPSTAIFHATPIEPGDLLREQLYEAFEASLLVSATLSVAGDFAYVKRRLGASDDAAREISLPSPFNTKKNLIVYSPSHLTEPNQFEKYIEDVTKQLVDLVGAASGGTFVLCTSYRILNALYDRFREEVPTAGMGDLKRGKRKRRKKVPDGKLLVLRQGESSRERLLDTFRKVGRAVLFGATTFWQGVDVPGQALELVVITRLPFQVPDDPVLEAKIQRCRNRGGNPFYEMQIPHAIVQFRQGIGRLIRSHSDRGAVALLDSRVVTKQYGKLFLDSLPECQITDDPEDVKTFLRSRPAQE